MLAETKLLPIKFTEQCGATKLLQAKLYGLGQASVFEALCKRSFKELGLANEDTAFEMHDIKHQVQNTLDNLPWTRSLGFEPILYNHELYHGFAHYYCEFGMFLWVDKSLTRFLLVDAHSRRICSPQWVRGTFVTPESRFPQNLFYDFFRPSSPTPTGVDPLKRPPIVHLTPSNTPPVLSARDIIPLDCLIRQAGLPVPSSVTRGKVLKPGDPIELPKVSTHSREGLVNEEVRRYCEGCEKKVSMDDMRRCGGCRRVFYCDRDCQRKGWKEHKKVCMPK
ncbi:hypothetical protein JCM6882_007353 [Rhodosporidiobolus microsporus]